MEAQANLSALARLRLDLRLVAVDQVGDPAVAERPAVVRLGGGVAAIDHLGDRQQQDRQRPTEPSGRHDQQQDQADEHNGQHGTHHSPSARTIPPTKISAHQAKMPAN